MLSFPIVDTHVHLYDPGRVRFSWMDAHPSLNRPHLVADFTAAAGPVQVDKIVFVEVDADPPDRLAEADWLTDQVRREPLIQGMVASVALERGRAARADLDQLKRHAVLRGVRRLIQSEPDPEFCLRPAFIEGIGLLVEDDLSFDICIYHHQLPAAIGLVQRCPNVRFVLDHVGKPAIRDGLIEPWRRHISDLARLPNVHCKLSGMATEADHRGWTRQQLRPYIDHIVETFGFERLMFGGDWPVARLAIAYPAWVETVLWALEGSSPDELRRLFRDNAIAFYRL